MGRVWGGGGGVWLACGLKTRGHSGRQRNFIPFPACMTLARVCMAAWGCGVVSGGVGSGGGGGGMGSMSLVYTWKNFISISKQHFSLVIQDKKLLEKIVTKVIVELDIVSVIYIPKSTVVFVYFCLFFMLQSRKKDPWCKNDKKVSIEDKRMACHCWIRGRQK